MAVYLISAALLVVVTAVLLLWPARSRRHGAAAAVYHDQLRELESDANAGKISAAEAQGLRAEIARRLLDAERQKASGSERASSPSLRLLFALIIPILAVPAYLWGGSPGTPDTPLAARIANAEATGDMEAMIAKVELHLAEKPTDANGWRILAPIYFQMGRYGAAVNAYGKLLELESPTAENFASMGEAMMFANEGLITKEAARAFDQALILEETHPKAAFYAALALKQEGKSGEALKRLNALLATAPKDAPWRERVESEIAAFAKGPALSQEQLQAGSAMAEGDQQAMIRGMVDGLEQRLAQDGSDFEGWLRLIRARTVLGETEKARQALAKASGLFQSSPEQLSAINALAAELKLQ